ncbi:alpha/beta hydrolase [Actinokineospora sp. NBRC 105648]|uniref:alpha/beta hydrolase n=1 Tax=Actinokineospora sp. NBRC 105648 TaxID=3032206 RepID=UPI0024A10A52|nr:alpha/beta hydrolase [Actinokineospora sp. NBRC 105648]GLZ36797.1 peptidase [Actinokineospora sp. NBRC 105648]
MALHSARSALRTVVLTAAVLASVASTAAALPAAAAPAAPAPAPAAAPVVWHECPPAELATIPAGDRARFSCADYAVPLDHARPRLGTINLALLRRAAGTPSAKIGSLFLNNGGPGASAFDFAKNAAARFEQPVLDRFDLIGFDPRGVARSTPLRCFATQEDYDAVFGKAAAIPLTGQQERDTIAANREYGRFCARFAGPLLSQASTEAVARDLDLLREAVGDERLTFVGFSYGTLLGATYANLFPQRSRAIILDGNVDPRLRLADGLEYDHQRTQGIEIALAGFLAECDRVGPKCAFSGGAKAKFVEVREYLKAHGPLTLPNGSQVGYEQWIGTTASRLYSPSRFVDYAKALQEAYAVLHPTARTAGLDRATTDALFASPTEGRRDSHPDTPYTADDSYAAVNCSDKPFHTPARDVPKVADRWEAELPNFGRYGVWGDTAICADWPVEHPDRYTGPWNRATPNPLLVLGNYYDPATRYLFAQRMSAQLADARLVSVDAFGHCILGNSKCVGLIAADYLINLRAPAPGQVCLPDRRPFD